MIRTAIKKKFPGLKQSQINEVATDVAVAIHARFYGANVDGVESPIWRDDARHDEWYKDKHPTKTAQELLDG
jgi:hypothetical protein